MDVFITLEVNTVVGVVIFSILGLLIGSFLNVVIYRLPIMIQQQWEKEVAESRNEAIEHSSAFNLIKPDSTCPHCGHRIRAWENIPVISYIALGGRCSACKTPISSRYPTIELVTALISGLVALRFGVSLEMVGLVIFFWALIALTMIDIDHQLLPDSLTLSLLWLGLLLNLNSLFISLDTAVIGAVAGYLSLWSVYWAFKLLTGKEGMGYGDFKLFAAFGAWFGWMALPLIILLSSLVGAVVGIAMIVILGRDRQIPIPFGPYLCGAALVYVFWGEAIMNWYLGSFA